MSKGKILIVDDSPLVRKLAEVSLQEGGYEVYTAENGEEGLKIAETVKPNLILVDFIMPKISGSQFCKLVRESETLKDIPIILITGKGEIIGQAFIEKYRVLDHFIKPFKSEDLVKKVDSLLSRIPEFTYEIPEAEIREVEEVMPSCEISEDEILQKVSLPEEVSIDLAKEFEKEFFKEDLNRVETSELHLSEELERHEVSQSEVERIQPIHERDYYNLSNIDKLIEDKLSKFSEQFISTFDVLIEGLLKKHGLIKNPSLILSGCVGPFKISEIFALINSSNLSGIFSVYGEGIIYEFLFMKGQIVYGISNLQKQKIGFKLFKELSHEEIKHITIEAISSLIKLQNGSFIFEIKQFSDVHFINKGIYSPSELIEEALK